MEIVLKRECPQPSAPSSILTLKHAALSRELLPCSYAEDAAGIICPSGQVTSLESGNRQRFETYPTLEMTVMEVTLDGCQPCHLVDRKSGHKAILSGKPYNKVGFEVRGVSL
jgi:hypothetical protein